MQLDAKFTDLRVGYTNITPNFRSPATSILTTNPLPYKLPNLPIKHLTPEEIQKTKRERGKCWFCDAVC